MSNLRKSAKKRLANLDLFNSESSDTNSSCDLSDCASTSDVYSDSNYSLEHSKKSKDVLISASSSRKNDRQTRPTTSSSRVGNHLNLLFLA
jgi:hypothetical protein